jgi:hypothetical protein
MQNFKRNTNELICEYQGCGMYYLFLCRKDLQPFGINLLPFLHSVLGRAREGAGGIRGGGGLSDVVCNIVPECLSM